MIRVVPRGGGVFGVAFNITLTGVYLTRQADRYGPHYLQGTTPPTPNLRGTTPPTLCPRHTAPRIPPRLTRRPH